jgi:hypothetical protein
MFRTGSLSLEGREKNSRPASRQEQIMSAYRRITRFLATAAAGASILVGLTACHLPFTSAEVADATRPVVHEPAIRQLPEIVSETIAEIPGALNDLNEVTDGPVRDAVIATACDAVAKGNDDPNWESGILDNLLEDTQPPEKQLLDTVRDLAATFTYDEQNGVTTQEEVGMACQAYPLKGNLG